MKPIVFHPAAEEEIERAAVRYEDQRDGLGREFRIEFEAALDRIFQFPGRYGVEFGEFRACPLRRFPFTMFYIELDDRIWIGAVAHQARRLGYWAGRRPN